MSDIKNPDPVDWPWPYSERDEIPAGMSGLMPGTMHDCGCHIRRPDYEAILCEEHLAQLNGAP